MKCLPAKEEPPAMSEPREPEQVSTVMGSTPPSLVLRTLRSVPRFRGKARIARTLLSAREKSRNTLTVDRSVNYFVVPNLFEPVGFSLAVDGSYEPNLGNLIRHQLNCKKDFIDVGANIGGSPSVWPRTPGAL
jgi:hypothetical protein